MGNVFSQILSLGGIPVYFYVWGLMAAAFMVAMVYTFYELAKESKGSKGSNPSSNWRLFGWSSLFSLAVLLFPFGVPFVYSDKMCQKLLGADGADGAEKIRKLKRKITDLYATMFGLGSFFIISYAAYKLILQIPDIMNVVGGAESFIFLAVAVNIGLAILVLRFYYINYKGNNNAAGPFEWKSFDKVRKQFEYGYRGMLFVRQYNPREGKCNLDTEKLIKKIRSGQSISIYQGKDIKNADVQGIAEIIANLSALFDGNAIRKKGIKATAYRYLDENEEYTEKLVKFFKNFDGVLDAVKRALIRGVEVSIINNALKDDLDNYDILVKIINDLKPDDSGEKSRSDLNIESKIKLLKKLSKAHCNYLTPPKVDGPKQQIVVGQATFMQTTWVVLSFIFIAFGSRIDSGLAPSVSALVVVAAIVIGIIVTLLINVKNCNSIHHIMARYARHQVQLQQEKTASRSIEAPESKDKGPGEGPAESNESEEKTAAGGGPNFSNGKSPKSFLLVSMILIAGIFDVSAIAMVFRVISYIPSFGLGSEWFINNLPMIMLISVGISIFISLIRYDDRRAKWTGFATADAMLSSMDKTSSRRLAEVQPRDVPAREKKVAVAEVAKAHKEVNVFFNRTISPWYMQLFFAALILIAVNVAASLVLSPTEDYLVVGFLSLVVFFLMLLAFTTPMVRSTGRLFFQMTIYFVGFITLGSTLALGFGFIEKLQQFFTPGILQWALPIAMFVGGGVAWISWVFDAGEYKAILASTLSRASLRYLNNHKPYTNKNPINSLRLTSKKILVVLGSVPLCLLLSVMRLFYVIKTGLWTTSLWLRTVFADETNKKLQLKIQAELDMRSGGAELETGKEKNISWWGRLKKAADNAVLHKDRQFSMLLSFLIALLPVSIGLSVAYKVDLKVAFYSMAALFVVFILVNSIYYVCDSSNNAKIDQGPGAGIRDLFSQMNRVRPLGECGYRGRSEVLAKKVDEIIKCRNKGTPIDKSDWVNGELPKAYEEEKENESNESNGSQRKDDSSAALLAS